MMQIRDSFLTSLGSASLPPSGRQAPSAINPIVLPAITGEIPVLGSVLPARVLEDWRFQRMRLQGERVNGPRQPRS